MRNVIALIAAAVVFVFLWIAITSGIHVEIENVGSTEITDVVVKVSGDTREIGTIDAGGTESVKVSPEGTTKRVEVTWKSDGREAYGKVEVIFEDSGYQGTVHFAIDGISVKEAGEDLDTGFF